MLQAVLGVARRRLIGFGVAESAAGVAAGALAALFVALVLVGLLPFSLGMRTALHALVGLGGLLALGVVVARRLLPLRHDLVVAARLEEAARRNGVELSDAVRGAVELVDASKDQVLGRSRALCDAHVRSTAERVASSGALSSLPAVGLQSALPTLLSLAGAILVVGLWATLGTESFKVRWARLFDDAVAAGAVAERQAALLPLVTDLKITLRFPAYMLEPDQVVTGSSGDIVAPRGTEVFLDGRADRPVSAAALLVDEAELALQVKDERQLSGRFVVEKSGAYRFRLDPVRGGAILDPVSHKITVKPDAAPSVELEAPTEDKIVQLDDEVPLAFAGKDDFGLTKFRVVVRRQSGADEPYVKDLLEVAAAPRELRGKGALKISETGARPGEKLSVFVEALDNDTVAGPKAGRSQTRVLTVFSAAEQHKKLVERLDDLLGKMVDSLGDELEAPIGEDGASLAAAEQLQLLTRHVAVHEREAQMFAALDDALAILRDDELAPQAVRRALANMKTELRPPYAQKKDLVDAAKRTATLGRELLPFAFRRMAAEQRVLVDRLETSTLYLDDLLAQERIAEAKQIAADMKRTQEELKALIEKYKKDGDPKTREALMARIQDLKAQMEQLMRRLAELQRDIPDEYLNPEALREQQQMMSEAQDLDRMIEEGKLDEALKALQEMVDGTQKMLEELDKTGEEYGGDEYKELREKMERFQQELEALKQAQDEASKRSEQLLEQARREAEKRLAGKLEKVLEELKQKAKQADKALDGVDQDGLFTTEQEDAAFAEARLDDLMKALEEGDLDDALMSAEQAENAARSVERSLNDRTRGKFGTRQKETMAAKERVAQARPILEEVRQELEKMLPDPSQMLDKQARQQLQRDADRQRQLQEGAERLRQLMDEIGKEAPIFSPQHRQKLEEAAGSMRGASRDLERQNLRGARGSQTQAGRALGDLQQALEEMGKDGQGGSGGMPMPLPGGSGEEGGTEGGRGNKSREEVKIPDGSEFRVPDAFRKDILDAMKEGAPQDWMGEVKRYYEELVK